MTHTIVCEDVRRWAETTAPIGAHAMLCDPPYELHFMNNRWDASGIAFRPETWAALARHLLPGAFVMAFASPRGYHRLACAMEDAGLVLHPSIFNYRTGETLEVPSLMGWGFASGFPKATRIDVQVDKRCRRDYVIAAQRLGLFIPQRNFDDWTREDHVPSDRWWEQFKAVLSDEDWQSIEREVIGIGTSGKTAIWNEAGTMGDFDLTAPATPLAQTWAGHRYGLQALKPALEPLIVAQVPYQGRPVESITEHGAGAMWIEGGRIATATGDYEHPGGHEGGVAPGHGGTMGHGWHHRLTQQPPPARGRWPANFVVTHLPQCVPLGSCQVPGTNIPGPGLRGIGYNGMQEKSGSCQNYAPPDGTETVPAYRCAPHCAVASLDFQAGERKSGIIHDNGSRSKFGGQTYANDAVSVNMQSLPGGYGDSGPASRFFHVSDWSLDVAEQLAHADPAYYCPKASPAERHAGTGGRNPHPTIKPLKLVEWLCRLLLAPAAYAPRRLLVPFCGTGSEMIGGILAGWETVVGIEHEASYVTLAERRLAYWTGMSPCTSVSSQSEAPVVPREALQAQLSLFAR